jgi:hypothetical protein
VSGERGAFRRCGAAGGAFPVGCGFAGGARALVGASLRLDQAGRRLPWRAGRIRRYGTAEAEEAVCGARSTRGYRPGG